LAAGPLGGLLAPWAALFFLARRPRLWGWAAAPFAINTGLFALFFWFSYTRFGNWLKAFLPEDQAWGWQILFYLLAALFILLLLALEIYLFALVGRVIAAPFLEHLTYKVEMELGAKPEELARFGLGQGMLRVLAQEAKKLFLYITLMLFLLLFNLLPGAGSAIYAALAFVLTCFFLALDFLDYPLERRGLSLGAKLKYVGRLKLTGLSFGAAVLALGVVPVVNLGLLPLAAVGGTLLFWERKRPGRLPPGAKNGDS